MYYTALRNFITTDGNETVFEKFEEITDEHFNNLTKKDKQNFSRSQDLDDEAYKEAKSVTDSFGIPDTDADGFEKELLEDGDMEESKETFEGFKGGSGGGGGAGADWGTPDADQKDDNTQDHAGDSSDNDIDDNSSSNSSDNSSSDSSGGGDGQ